jgi:protein tyrosine phosphatase
MFLGRTGTFVAIEMVCHKLLNENKPDFEMTDLMQDLRSKRMHAVQNDTVSFPCIFNNIVLFLAI